MDGEAGWWTTSGNMGLPPLARVMGVGRQHNTFKNEKKTASEMKFLGPLFQQVPLIKRKAVRCANDLQILGGLLLTNLFKNLRMRQE